MRDLPRLIDTLTEMSDGAGLVERVQEVQIRRRVVDRIRIENHQPGDLAGIEIGYQAPSNRQADRSAAESAGSEETTTALPVLPSAALMAIASETTDSS